MKDKRSRAYAAGMLDLQEKKKKRTAFVAVSVCQGKT